MLVLTPWQLEYQSWVLGKDEDLEVLNQDCTEAFGIDVLFVAGVLLAVFRSRLAFDEVHTAMGLLSVNPSIVHALYGLESSSILVLFP